MGMDIESVTEATSGAIGALLSTTILYPLDTCKSKFQAEVGATHLKEIQAISNKQLLSLYQGLGTKNLQSFISQFIYFYGYSFFKRLYLGTAGSKALGTKANLIIAAAPGAVNVVIIHPLDTASSKMQTSEFGKSKSLWKTLTEKTWSGLGISLLLTANPSLQYTVFDQLKQRLLNEKMKKKADADSSPAALSALSAFVLAAVSKCIATTLTYPAIRCKATIQAAESEEYKMKEKRTMSGVVSEIWRKEGSHGFFKGLEAQILKTVLGSALHLMIKEKISKTTWFLMLAIRRFFSVASLRLKSD